MILVDSNILIDLFDKAQAWWAWSAAQVAALDNLVVNQVAFAEVGSRIGSLDEFGRRLAAAGIAYEPFSDEAAYAAGLAFLAYRSRRPGAKMVLPDFFIGGHAAATGSVVLTRDPRFYRTYFPKVPLITPDKAAP